MAEDIKKKKKSEEPREPRVILEELFFSTDSAIEKCARVRHTYYEIGLWLESGVALADIDGGAKVYFAKRFLGNSRINDVPRDRVLEGYERLRHAAEDGTIGRCTRLCEELNEAMAKMELGLEPVKPKEFIDWLTFDYFEVKNGEGEPVYEPKYGFKIKIFRDAEHRKFFKKELRRRLNKDADLMSMADIARIANKRRRIERIKKEIALIEQRNAISIKRE